MNRYNWWILIFTMTCNSFIVCLFFCLLLLFFFFFFLRYRYVFNTISIFSSRFLLFHSRSKFYSIERDMEIFKLSFLFKIDITVKKWFKFTFSKREIIIIRIKLDFYFSTIFLDWKISSFLSNTLDIKIPPWFRRYLQNFLFIYYSIWREKYILNSNLIYEIIIYIDNSENSKCYHEKGIF